MPNDLLQVRHPLRDFQPLDEFIAEYAPRPEGQPYTRRGMEGLLKRLKLPIVKIGTKKYVDLVRLAEQLHEKPYKRKTRTDKGQHHNWKAKRQRVRLYD